MENDDKTVKLRDGPKQTATWVKILETGDVFVDHYDYSDQAQAAFGNDVAYLLTIKAAEKPRLVQLLAPGNADEQQGVSVDDALLQLTEQKFESFSDLKAWLKDVDMEFEEGFDSWA